MTLSFSREINGKPNYFVEKIWKFLIDSDNVDFRNTSANYERDYEQLYPCKYIEQENIHYHKPKLHTIRRDEKNRWQAGKIIHPVINNRTPDRFQFAPCFPCVSTQKIDIKYSLCDVYGFNGTSERVDLYIDGCHRYSNYWWSEDYLKRNPEFDIKDLAINDGFDSLEDFLSYFNKDFTGKIIHFTDLRY